LQEKLAFLPDYGFKTEEEPGPVNPGETARAEAPVQGDSWPAVNAGTSVSGLIGGIMTMGLAGVIGFGLRRYRRKR
jgi:cobalt/nickel transport system permease protein